MTSQPHPKAPAVSDVKLPQYIDMKTFARAVNLPLDSAYKMKYKADFPRYAMIGGRIQIRVTDLEEWLETKAVNPLPQCNRRHW